MSLRAEVLSFYKRVIRLSQEWQALNPLNTSKERLYMTSECKRLIRENRHLTDDHHIRALLQEGMGRLQVAQHYRIPYPRPVYYPTGAYLRKHK